MMIKFLKIPLTVAFCWVSVVASGQSLTLEDCYRFAKENYPALKKTELVSAAADYAVKNANKRFLPQLNISGQATYQSQVADYSALLGNNTSAMGIVFPEFSKDQYRISGEVEQLIFDGGSIRQQNKITKADAAIQQQNAEIELYKINERINSIFFSAFLLDAQLNLNQLKISDLQSQLDKTEAAYKFGTAYLSDVNELKAEIENTKSANVNYEHNRNALLKMLAIFIGRESVAFSELVKPEAVMVSDDINRPELKLYDLQKASYDAHSSQLKSSYLPTLSAFFQGAYGRPTLNALSNDFGAWYVTGVRLRWSLGSLYTLKNQRQIFGINKEIADADKQTFIQNVKMEIAQQDEDIKKYTEMIAQDRTTIALREAVTQSASAQLANGVITTNEYIQKVNSENAAKQNLILHEIQLLQAQYAMKFKTGN